MCGANRSSSSFALVRNYATPPTESWFELGCGCVGQSRTTSAEDCCFFRPKLSFVRGFKIRRSAFGGRGGRGRAALRRLRLLFITANSVARMRRLLTELTQRRAASSVDLVAHVLLFQTCGSCSLCYDGAVPFQAYKVACCWILRIAMPRSSSASRVRPKPRKASAPRAETREDASSGACLLGQ